MTVFAYVPVTRPGLPSRMFQNAYEENLPLVGPEGTVFAMHNYICLNLHIGDLDGWHTLPPLTIRGKLFDSHATEATLSVSDPLLRRINKTNIVFTVGPCETCKNIPISQMHHTGRSDCLVS